MLCRQTLILFSLFHAGLFHDISGTLNGRKLEEDGSILYGCTCNLSIDMATVPLYFDTKFPDAAFEDVEFCVRARKMGIPMRVNRNAIVYHNYQGGIGGLFRQFRRYGRNEDLVRFASCFVWDYLSWATLLHVRNAQIEMKAWQLFFSSQRTRCPEMQRGSGPKGNLDCLASRVLACLSGLY